MALLYMHIWTSDIYACICTCLHTHIICMQTHSMDGVIYCAKWVVTRVGKKEDKKESKAKTGAWMGAWMDGGMDGLFCWTDSFRVFPLPSINTGSPLCSHCFLYSDTITIYKISGLVILYSLCFGRAGGET